LRRLYLAFTKKSLHYYFLYPLVPEFTITPT